MEETFAPPESPQEKGHGEETDEQKATQSFRLAGILFVAYAGVSVLFQLDAAITGRFPDRNVLIWVVVYSALGVFLLRGSARARTMALALTAVFWGISAARLYAEQAYLAATMNVFWGGGLLLILIGRPGRTRRFVGACLAATYLMALGGPILRSWL